MGFNIDSIRAIQQTDASNRVQQGGTPTESNRAVFQRSDTQFTTTNSYKQFQSQMLKVLEQQGFKPQQAQALANIGTLPIEQLVRLIALAHKVKSNKDQFQKMTAAIKNIIDLGKNIPIGLKSYLDGIEDILGVDIQKIIQHIKDEQQQNNQQQSQQNKKEEEDDKDQDRSIASPKQEIELNAYKEVQQQLQQAGVANLEGSLPSELQFLLTAVLGQSKKQKTTLTPNQLITMQEFHELLAHSIEEFPQRYFIDLFSFSQLSQKGMSLDQYLKLSSEVSPLRLLNLITSGAKFGHTPHAIIDSLMSTLENGGLLFDAIENLEYKFGITPPQDPKAINSIPKQSITAKQAKITQGEPLFLTFMGLDSQEGLIPAEKSGFVLYPQQHNYSGLELNLAFLPVGSYMIMTYCYDSNHMMMNRWIKVIVQASDQSKQQKTFEQFQQEQEQKKQEQEHPKQQQATSSLSAPSQPGIVADFSKQPDNFTGPFMGEILLPFDLMEHESDDLLIMSSHSGMIVDENDFYHRNFSNNAVAFRFLAPYTKTQKLSKRHGLLDINHSRIFSDYNQGLIKFIKSPALELENWKKTLQVFFDALESMFPQGQESFNIAKRFFEQESINHAKGQTSGDWYSHTSLESHEGKFLSAFYSKGSYAMAHAGDATGAIQSMTFASLVDLDNENNLATLGEYLNALKAKYYAHDTSSAQNSHFEMHLKHQLDKAYIGNSYYKDLGKNFVKAANLSLPQAKTGLSNQSSTGYGVGAYGKY